MQGNLLASALLRMATAVAMAPFSNRIKPGFSCSPATLANVHNFENYNFFI